MKLLLDTNVWRYLVDTGRQNDLYGIARQSNVKVVVAPATVIETFYLRDSDLRRKIVQAQTKDCWKRLMPDAYLQSEDVKREMLRLHPEWALPEKNINRYKQLRYDWVRKKGGFWEEARKNTNAFSSNYRSRFEGDLDYSRSITQEVRSEIVDAGRGNEKTKDLAAVPGSWKTVEGDIVTVDGWRVYAELVWQNMLIHTNSPLRDWIGCEINIDLLFTAHAQEYLRFWECEVQVEGVPREWLRAAAYVFQREHKVTDGNPIDASITVHLIDVDVFVSADKNLISMVNQIHEQAPFKTARGVLIGAGNEGVDRFFKMIAERFP